LAQVGRLWTKLMSEFDQTKDYAHCDVSGLSSAAPSVAAAARVATAPAATPVPARPVSPSVSPSASPFGDGPLDLTRTVRMDLVRRPRGDEVDDQSGEPSPALTCILPSGGLNAAKPGSFSSSADSEPNNSVGVDEEIKPGTIRVDPNAVKRALAESVIAELTTVEGNADGEGTNAVDSSLVDAANAVASEAASLNATANTLATPVDQSPNDRPPIDEYTEPPVPALSPDLVDEEFTRPDSPPLTGPRVLVVDDSPTVRKLVASTLESRGYRVACCASGYEAVEILSQATPDALVIEVDLPRLDGLHLCKLLRSQDATRNTPVIFLTRRSGTMDRMRGKMVGATAYLTKPFRSVALIEELSTCCPSN
jgi:twitching motility two-component system response regulator PilG